MNEASSRYVDNLAMDKLIAEKLSRTSHSPWNSSYNNIENLFDNLDKLKLDVSSVYTGNINGCTCFLIPSFLTTQHSFQNNTIYLYSYTANKPTGNVLLLHGLFDNSLINYTFLIRMLNGMNLNVFFMTLPYHIERTPAESSFSGEFFLSADIYRSQHAFRQAVFDVEACLQFISVISNFPVIIAGFSLGGCIAFRYYILRKYSIGTFMINPVADLSGIMWDNPLLKTVLCDLKKSGISRKTCEEAYFELDPVKNLGPDFDNKRIHMVYSLYDQIVEAEKSETLIRTAGLNSTNAYNSGHLNILRVPKLSRDIYDFFRRIESSKEDT